MKPLRTILRNPNCRLCPLHETAQSVCLIGDGQYPADIMLIGEAPGYREDDLNKPFQGRAGQLLDSILHAFKISRSSIFISNSVHCRPPENRRPRNNEIKICSRTYLTEEVRAVKPKIIIALGGVAAQGILQNYKKIAVNASRNKIYYTKEPFLPKIPVVVTFHPAAALRNQELDKDIISDFEFALRILTKGVKSFKTDTHYQLVNSIEEIPNLFQAKRVSLDLETDGLNPYLSDRDIISVQISVKEGSGYYLKWNDQVKEEIRRLIKTDNVIVGHNVSKYDRNWLILKAGIYLKKVEDTLMMAQLYDENIKPKSLGVLSSTYTDLKQHKQEMQEYVKEHKCDWKDVPLEIAVPYGCGDVDAALRLRNFYIPRLKEDGLMPMFQLLMRETDLYAELERNGAQIDSSLIDSMADHYDSRLSKLHNRINHLANREINPKSHQQLKELLYEKWRLPAVGTGKYPNSPPIKNTAEGTLLNLLEFVELTKRQEKFLRYVLRYKEASTELSRYILSLSDLLMEDGRVHPNYKLHGTLTGRSACADPNLQNIPRQGPIKRLFPSRYGERGCLLQADVSQGELRFAAHYSEEPTLLRLFRLGGVDIHQAVAARVLRKAPELITEEERKKAKVVNFGILYGAGISKMAKEMKCSEQEAANFLRLWNSEFSAWKPYVKSIHQQVMSGGTIRSCFGRIRHIPTMDWNSERGKASLRQAVNSPIQGGLHDYVAFAGCNIRDRFRKEGIKDVKFIVDGHDAWVWDSPLDRLEQVVPIIKEEMENPDLSRFGFKMKVPILVDIKVGKTWHKEDMKTYGD